MGATAAVVGVAAVGSFAQSEGSKAASKAAKRAAKAQEKTARAELKFAKESQERAIEAAKSPEEFAQLQQAQQFQNRQLQRQEKLIKSLDPAILEAATQATQLLRGEEAKSLQPVRDQRARQRQQLVNQLREQLGPGAETSSVGQQALQRFDQGTSSQLAGLQQQSLNQLFTIGSFESGRGSRTLRDTLGVAQGFGDIARRNVGAITGSQGAISQAGAQAVGAAGSQFVGAQLAGQSQAALGGQLIQGSLGLATAFVGRPQATKPVGT